MEPDSRTSPGRYAPYPVWMTMRIVTMIATAMALIWLVSAIAALFSAVDGGKLQPLPVWVGIVGMIIGGSGKWSRPDDNVPPFGEIIGRLLASKKCPSCGQSIFDHTPASGYAPEVETKRWWPSRTCTNCGHDMARRNAP